MSNFTPNGWDVYPSHPLVHWGGEKHCERNENEGVRGKKPQVTLDLMSNSPFLYKEKNGNLPRETCRLLDLT